MMLKSISSNRPVPSINMTAMPSSVSILIADFVSNGRTIRKNERMMTCLQEEVQCLTVYCLQMSLNLRRNNGAGKVEFLIPKVHPKPLTNDISVESILEHAEDCELEARLIVECRYQSRQIGRQEQQLHSLCDSKCNLTIQAMKMRLSTDGAKCLYIKQLEEMNELASVQGELEAQLQSLTVQALYDCPCQSSRSTEVTSKASQPIIEIQDLNIMSSSRLVTIEVKWQRKQIQRYKSHIKRYTEQIESLKKLFDNQVPPVSPKFKPIIVNLASTESDKHMVSTSTRIFKESTSKQESKVRLQLLAINPYYALDTN